MGQRVTDVCWMHIVATLSGRVSAANALISSQRVSDRCIVPGANIKLLDRLSEITIAVEWGHACSGHCGSEVWRRTVAKSKGVCALSGDNIARGDAIYKPWGAAHATEHTTEILLALHVESKLRSDGLSDAFEEMRHAEEIEISTSSGCRVP